MNNNLLLLGFITSLAAGCGEVVPQSPVLLDAAPQPTADSLSPDHGPIGGGTVVTISGSGFGSGEAVVVVGDLLATDVTIESDSEISFTAPPYPLDNEIVDVTVSTQNGFVDMPRVFRYHAQPRIVSISPSIGRMSGGTTVTLTGRGFVDDDAGVPTVTVAGAALTNVQIVDDETLTGSLGVASGVKAFVPVDVVFENANGTSTLVGGIRLSKQGILAVERSASGVWYIDPTENHAVKLSTPQLRIRACATNAAGTIFATRGRASGTANSELGTLDPLTGEFTSIGLTNLAGVNKSVGNLQFAGTTLYGGVGGNAAANKNFYSVNTTTGALTQIGTALATVIHTALGPRDGSSLWLIDRLDQTIDTIAVGTGAVSAGAVTITGGSTTTAMGMVSFSSTLYLTDRTNPSNLYSLNTTTGALTRIALPGLTTNLHGLCNTPPSF